MTYNPVSDYRGCSFILYIDMVTGESAHKDIYIKEEIITSWTLNTNKKIPLVAIYD